MSRGLGAVRRHVLERLAAETARIGGPPPWTWR